MSLEKSLWSEYPIPKSVSVWGGIPEDDNDFSLKDLINTCVRELRSDLFVTDYMTASANQTQMPEDTVAVLSVQYATMPVQGNIYVKKNYIKANNTLLLRYFPAYVTYKRRLRTSDIDLLEGDDFKFFKAYVLYKMASKEIVVIESVTLNSDNSEVNTTSLQRFRDDCKQLVDELKEGISLYSHGS
jgi:hypothetical protein